jgi:tetratricopeptide (TPR) repeat protein
MNLFLLSLLLVQTPPFVPTRTAIENPAAVSPIPPKLKKDYEKLWMRFVSGKDDAKLAKDLDKLLKKQKSFDAAWILQAYLALYKNDQGTARSRFTQALALDPKNRIAIYYLAEMAFAQSDYARAAVLYSQLISLNVSGPDMETKRQTARLLATDNMLRAAALAESENRLGDAEGYYRQALLIAPNEPALHVRLADLLAKENRASEAAAERKIAEDLSPRQAARPRDGSRADDLEDIGRWGSDIEVFHRIRDAEVLTREQLAVLLVKYFPQLTEFRPTPQIITDLHNSSAETEIQTVVGLGLVEPKPNHDFEPAAPITRGDLARALARLSRLIGVAGTPSSTITAPDVSPTNAMYPDIQLVLGSGLMTLDNPGGFDVTGRVGGRQAVRATERLLRRFQQAQR